MSVYYINSDSPIRSSIFVDDIHIQRIIGIFFTVRVSCLTPSRDPNAIRILVGLIKSKPLI